MSDRTVPLIVVGVDGSDDGLRAVRFGANTALGHGAELMLVNAVDDTLMAGAWGVVYDPEVLQAAGVSANEQAKGLALEIGLPAERIKTEVVMGSPGGVMARLSEVADLVVVGRRAATGLERMFVGSTSVAVVANASCPVVVISAAAHPSPVGSKGLVGVGLQTDPGSEKTLKAGFEQAKRLGSRLEIIHAIQPPVGLFARRLSPAQLAIFRTFFASDLQGGALPFSWTHPATGAIGAFRIVPPLTIEPIAAGIAWRVTLELELLP